MKVTWLRPTRRETRERGGAMTVSLKEMTLEGVGVAEKNVNQVGGKNIQILSIVIYNCSGCFGLLGFHFFIRYFYLSAVCVAK